MRSTAIRYRTLLVTLAGAAALVLAIFAMLRFANGPPYLLIIKPSMQGAAVQFVQRDSRAGGRLISPTFHVPVSVSADSQIILASPNVAVPQGIVEFADTTLMPGRFRIRFGNVVLDVMESRIIVDGISHEWIPDDGGA